MHIEDSFKHTIVSFIFNIDKIDKNINSKNRALQIKN